MARGQSRRRKLVPEAGPALDRLKYEIAAELGLSVGNESQIGADTEFAVELGNLSNSFSEPYWGHLPSRDAGAVGGHITRTLIANAQKTLMEGNTIVKI